ncbi:DUF5412 domain-containing protein [Anaerocolumna chitinilytica]|uniref:DUF5412 domain-containing protein n=1 Tax=Anaerocolumna chitinilytica TaxID=1727145 RepID=A0A7I8DQ21_9FIRM|nr:DUF5412 domain-containing protein [Anaerocolumna chitinilytica]BCJ98376.1 hypothetical protein bsdcttw_14170 [Anaerocolumna chitinilytica]
MKKPLRIGLILLLISVLVFYGIYWAFYDMNRLPKGDLISEIVSPDGEYTLKAYLVNGGATVAYCIRGELNYNLRNKKPKTIYWNYRETEAKVEWKDKDTVVINGHLLNVEKEVYDWRREN